MADNCTEGHRKKAKYLLDEEELGKHPHDLFPDVRSHLRPPPEALKRAKSGEGSSKSTEPAAQRKEFVRPLP